MTCTSKSKTRAKTRLVLALILAVSLTSACTDSGNTEKTPSGPSDVNNGNSAIPPVNNENSSNLKDPEVAVPDEEESADNPSDSGTADTVITAEGTFNGQVDGHTVELETENGIMSIQHGDDLYEIVSGLNKDDRVKFVYVVKEYTAGTETFQQLWLISIVKF